MTEAENTSPWQTDDNTGFEQFYEGRVIEATFGVRSDYNNGESVLLELKFKVDHDVNEDGELSEIYPIGKGWEARDGGEHVVNPKGEYAGTGKGTYPKSNSSMGMLIDAMIAADGFSGLNMDSPFNASSWVGICMDTYTETSKYTIGGEKRERRDQLPTRVWREGQTPPAANVAAAPAPAPVTPTPAPAPAPVNEAPAVSPAAAAKAKALAAQQAAQAPATGAGGRPDIPGMEELVAIHAKATSYNQFVELVYSESPTVLADMAGELALYADDPANWAF